MFISLLERHALSNVPAKNTELAYEAYEQTVDGMVER